ncbi:DUF3325 domain-containing protein [Dyella sp. 333MFSha]|uniref:DUF3325 domain-containing protein n=1 Tax=Dyella sp. 333MFSha TaxID=1798240 RepID=UPI00088AD726|nr:DUF3325 domain-containing protein [Dyella sp. 333MFSha]SDG22528.1 Protein of unknown function [Dyella sp. 333MFSha]
MILLPMLASLLGFTLLCLGLSRHQRDLFGRAMSPGRTVAARWIGWTLVVLAYGGSMLIEGAALGAVYGVGVLTFGALVVAFTVTGMSR